MLFTSFSSSRTLSLGQEFLQADQSSGKTYHLSLGNANSRRSRMSKAAHDESFWRDKSVLVTGSSGFAGRNLCVLLSSLGSRVRFFDRSKNDFSANQPGTSFVLGTFRGWSTLAPAMFMVGRRSSRLPRKRLRNRSISTRRANYPGRVLRSHSQKCME